MPINMERIRNALNKQAAAGGKTQFKQNKYFKPGIGRYDIRILPYLSAEGEPVQDVLYYEKLTEDGKRLVAPQTFGLPDPVRDLYDEKRREKGGWAVAKFMKPKKRFYALLIDRKDEAAGPQIWEFSEELRDAVYTSILSPDYQDEDIFDPDKGYDWELTVTQTFDGDKPKTFNGNIVKKYNLSVRKRPSLLHKDKAIAKKWLEDMPKLSEMFTRMCKTPEELIEILENFVARLETQGEPKNENGTDHNATKAASPVVSATPVTAPVSSTTSDEDVEQKLEDAFSGM